MNDYSQAWQRYRKLRNQFWLVFAGQIAIISGFLTFSDALRRNIVPCLVFVGLWTLLFVVAAIRLQSFRCPRCGEKFFVSGYYHNSFASKCLRCGLPKFSS